MFGVFLFFSFACFPTPLVLSALGQAGEELLSWPHSGTSLSKKKKSQHMERLKNCHFGFWAELSSQKGECRAGYLC